MKFETETSIYKKDAVKDAIKNKVVHGANPTGNFNVGDTWFNPNEGYKMYSWNGTGWDPEQLDSDAIKAGAIKAGHIDAGAVTADKIAANSISASKLSVGMENLATVNEWDDDSMVSTPSGYETATAVINSTSGLKAVVKGNAENEPDATNTHLGLSQYKIPNIFATGDEIYYSLRIRAVNTARSVSLRIAAYNSAGTYLGTNYKTLAVTTSFQKFSGTITLENGNDWAWSNNSGNLPIAASYFIYINDPNGAGDQLRLMQIEVRKKNSGDLIVGGTIEGSRIRTPVGDSYEMAHVSNKPAGTIYVDEFIPIPSGANDSYMQMMQSGVESVDSSLNVRSQMAPIKLKLYNTDESPSHLTGTEYGWYLGKVAYAERVFTEKGEVATIDPNNENAIVNATPYTFTPSNGSAWSTLGGCWFYKIGTRVHLHVAVTGLTANTNTVVYDMSRDPSSNIWSGYLPYGTVVAAGRGNDGSTFASMWVASDGTVTVRSTGTNAAVDIEYDAFN